MSRKLPSPALAIPLIALSLVAAALRDDAAQPPVDEPLTTAQPMTQPAAQPAAQPIAQPAAQPVPASAEPPVIELVFALDTTGSMSGLIEGAKEKIWSIVDQFASGEPRPDIRIGLVAYRDRGDAYVTQVVPLTSDLDAVYEKLLALHAEGGGDTPESVNQALHEAVTAIQWTQREKVYRAIFVVGDAPPHTDYADDVQAGESVALARQRGITVHGVLCGGDGSAGRAFAAMAKQGGGAYLEVSQSGGMVAMSTPMDDDLARLNRELSGLGLAWGSDSEKQEISDKLGRAMAAPTSRLAARGSYLSKSGGKVVSGRKDLVDAIIDGDVDLEAIEVAALPASLAGLDREAQKQAIADNNAQREHLKQQISQTVAKRDAWIAAENARLASEGGGDAFDAQLRESVIEQVEALGYVSY